MGSSRCGCVGNSVGDELDGDPGNFRLQLLAVVVSDLIPSQTTRSNGSEPGATRSGGLEILDLAINDGQREGDRGE